MEYTREKLIKDYIDFFKKHKHVHIPSSSLIPENDPTVLFTTAGMHPLVPFLLGEKHPHGKRLVSVQKCIRTGDIDEVGD
ncbi:MAG: alanine--tRNA ligase-related protein, partial [Nanoarchaeota archaeon]